eukprot:210787-Prymnesium_polylepis.3
MGVRWRELGDGQDGPSERARRKSSGRRAWAGQRGTWPTSQTCGRHRKTRRSSFSFCSEVCVALK